MICKFLRNTYICSSNSWQEDAFDLVTAIKNVGVYRRSKKRDFVSDYIPPSPSEVKDIMDKNRWVILVWKLQLQLSFLLSIANIMYRVRPACQL